MTRSLSSFGIAVALAVGAFGPVAGSAGGADAEVVAFLTKHAKAIPERDGAWIDRYLGAERVVLVGEETHGIAEHLELKRELGLRLVEEHAFPYVVIEDDVWKFEELSQNLRVDTPRPARELCGELFWCWNVEELHGFFDALADVDAAPALVGMDVQTPRGALRVLRDLAGTGDRAAAVEAVAALFADGRTSYASRSVEDREAGLRSIAGLEDALPGARARRARRHLERVAAVWAGGDDHGVRMKARDRGMAASVDDLLAESPRSRAVVLAHNAHGGYQPFYASFTGGVTPVGAHLRDTYGHETLSIGVVFATGTRLLDPRAREKRGRATETTTEAASGSQAAVWGQLPHERWVLDQRELREVELPAAVRGFLDTPPEGHFDNYGPAPSLLHSYDLLVGYRRVSAATVPAR